MVVIAIVGACAGKNEPPRTAPPPIASVAPTSAPPIESVDAEAPITKDAPRVLDSRTRAAFGTILHLRKYALTMLDIDKGGQFTKNGCPTAIEWVTWGMAKTDPWDHGFRLRCVPGSKDPQIGSAGVDGTWDTKDDLWTDHPIIDATRGCESACTKMKSCASASEVTTKICSDACGKDTTEINFYADTCAQLDTCESAVSCMKLAVKGNEPWGECSDFGRLAAKLKPGTQKALVTECEKDLVRAHELPCVADSKNAHELSLCFLTVNRMNVERILKEP